MAIRNEGRGAYVGQRLFAIAVQRFSSKEYTGPITSIAGEPESVVLKVKDQMDAIVIQGPVDPQIWATIQELAETNQDVSDWLNSVSTTQIEVSYWWNNSKGDLTIDTIGQDPDRESRRGSSGPSAWERQSGDVFIGPYALRLPGPSSITIREDYSIDGAAGLRTDTDPIWRKNKGFIRIQIDKVYTGAPEINQGFRAQLAFLRACPLTPLRGPMLDEVLHQEFRDETDFETIKDYIRGVHGAEDRALQLLQRYDPDADETNLATLKEKLSSDDPLGDWWKTLNQADGGFNPQDPIPGKEVKHIFAMFGGFSVSSIESAPETIRVQWHFHFMNDLSVSRSGIRFLDKNGNPTPDINECVWLKRYVDLAYLDPRRRVTYLPEFLPHTSLENIAEELFEYSLPSQESKKTISGFTDGIRSGNSERIVVRAVATGFENKVANIPLVGEPFTSSQYMGRKNGTAQIELICTSDGLEQIHRMKHAVERNVRSPLKTDRSETIKVTNNIINMCGMSDFVITRMTTEPLPDSPSHFRVLLSLIESRVDLSRREQLVYDNQRTPKWTVKSFWNYLYKKYREFIARPRFPFAERPLSTQYAIRVLFGPSHGYANASFNPERGILNADLLAYGLLYGDKKVVDRIERFTRPDFVTGSTVISALDSSSDSRIRRRLGQGMVKPFADIAGDLFRGRWSEDDVDAIAVRLLGSYRTLVKTVQEDSRLYSGLTKDEWDWMLEAMIYKPSPSKLSFTSDTYVPYRINRIAEAHHMLTLMVAYYADRFPDWEYSDYTTPPVPLRNPDPDAVNNEFSDHKYLEHLSTYPDFHLPTYRDVFTEHGTNTVDPVWKKFAPTWDSLGISPTITEANHLSSSAEVLKEPAVTVMTPVEPTFFFARGSYKEVLKEQLERYFSRNAISSALDLSTARIAWTSNPGDRPTESDIPHIADLIDHKVYADKTFAEKVERVKGGGITLVLMAEDRNVPLAKLIPDSDERERYRIEVVDGPGRIITDIDGFNQFDPQSASNLRAILERNLEELPEDKLNVARCFPTFRLKFIDFDTGLYADEFYDYNAINKIEITQDKNDASTCVIEIMNATGSLDEDKFLTDKQLRELNILPDDEPRDIRNDDPTDFYDSSQGKIFSRMKLKEGTSIQVLMGYGPIPDLLETVFTGRISAYEPGDVITIVAQDYKTELLNEVSFQSESETGIGGIIRALFARLDGVFDLPDSFDDEDINEAIIDEELKNGTPHLGTRFVFNAESEEKISRNVKDIFGEELSYSNQISIGEGNRRVASGRNLFDLMLDKPNRLRNINLLASVYRDRNWLALYQPAFDVLQEIARFYPGWICQVVPYDHLGTVYLGPPEGVYYWTSRYNERLRHRLDRLRGGSIRPPIQGLLDAVKGFIEFTDRRFGTSSSSTVDRSHLETALGARGDISNRAENIRSQAPELYRAVVAGFFGLNLISEDSLPPRIQAQFWDAIDHILKDRDIEDLRYRLQPNDQFLITVAQLPQAIDPNIRDLIERLSYPGVRGSGVDITLGPLEGLNPTGGITLLDLLTRHAKGRLFRRDVYHSDIFRLYILSLEEYLNESDPETVKLLGQRLKDVAWLEKDPDKRPFKRVHHVTTRYDIIKNNIVASMSEMANTVLLRYPSSLEVTSEEGLTAGEFQGQSVISIDGTETTWEDFISPHGISFHENIRLEEKKLNIALEKNVYNDDGDDLTQGRASLVFLNRMADSLRPMYRGNIVIWGRNVKPHDTVYIFDDYNEMTGPIDVERVVHHFTAQTGWTTTIVPHASIQVNNNIEVFQKSALLKFLETANTVLDVAGYVSIGVAVLSLAAGGGLKAIGTGARKIIQAGIKKEIGRQLKNRATVQGVKQAGLAGFTQVAKRVGQHVAGGMGPSLTWAGRGAAFWALSGPFQGLGSIVAEGDLPNLKGVVNVMPLMYQGRPLVAGLRNDDRYYNTLLGLTWKKIGNVWEDIVDYIAATSDEEEIIDLPDRLKGDFSRDVGGPDTR